MCWENKIESAVVRINKKTGASSVFVCQRIFRSMSSSTIDNSNNRSEPKANRYIFWVIKNSCEKGKKNTGKRKISAYRVRRFKVGMRIIGKILSMYRV